MMGRILGASIGDRLLRKGSGEYMNFNVALTRFAFEWMVGEGVKPAPASGLFSVLCRGLAATAAGAESVWGAILTKWPTIMPPALQFRCWKLDSPIGHRLLSVQSVHFRRTKKPRVYWLLGRIADFRRSVDALLLCKTTP